MGQVREVTALTPEESETVLRLASAAAAHDGVRPLSEAALLDVRRAGPDPEDQAPTVHLLLDDGPVAAVRGYGRVELSDPPSAEIVVAPDSRHHGLGGRLVDHALQRWPQVRLWAHGDLASARRLYRSRGLEVARELWQMSRPLDGEWSDLPVAQLPEGFTVRPFQPGRDEAEWLRVNARAFADHAEQGRISDADLRERMAEPWFDPAGFLLVEDVSGPGEARLAAFHWTKVEPGGAEGEVYVVGVDPAYQGRGLGRAATLLGLQHLRAAGLRTARLYVDGDNTAAIATYGRLGFERSAVDVMYAATA